MITNSSGHSGADHDQPPIRAGDQHVRGLPKLGDRACQRSRHEATTLVVLGVERHPRYKERLVQLGDLRQLVVGLAEPAPAERKRLLLALDSSAVMATRTDPQLTRQIHLHTRVGDCQHITATNPGPSHPRRTMTNGLNVGDVARAARPGQAALSELLADSRTLVHRQADDAAALVAERHPAAPSRLPGWTSSENATTGPMLNVCLRTVPPGSDEQIGGRTLATARQRAPLSVVADDRFARRPALELAIELATRRWLSRAAGESRAPRRSGFAAMPAREAARRWRRPCSSS